MLVYSAYEKNLQPLKFQRNFILSNLMGIFGVITNLFKYETLSDEKSAKNLIEIIKAYWPWIKNNYEVKSIVLEALVTATESSIIGKIILMKSGIYLLNLSVFSLQIFSTVSHIRKTTIKDSL